MEQRHMESAVNILKNIHYLTIATVCSDGSPWNSPVSATYDETLNFFWGSSPDNIHSQNIRNNPQVFIVVFNSTVGEGEGEGIYMRGTAEELDFEDGDSVKKYKFVPSQIWINDEAKNDDGSYKHDIRVEIDMTLLKNKMNQ